MSSPLPLVFGLSALLLIGVSVPLVLRKVRPNRWYGFRTPATLKDERLWYEVNARTGMDMLGVGAGLLGITLAHVAGALGEQPFLWVAMIWTQVGILASVVHGAVVIQRYGKHRG